MVTNQQFEARSRSFCEAFTSAHLSRRFVLGRGEYAASVARAIPIAGFVDDYTSEASFMGIPVISAIDLPDEALVVVASMLRPSSALRSLEGTRAVALDYFAFERFSGLDLKPVTFWSEFRDDYQRNRERYEIIRARLVDDDSRDVFDGLIRFRLTADVTALSRCKYDMVNQYFEDFLELAPEGESFVDIGCFDGFTSLEFARRAPGFKHITAFEPSPENYSVVLKNLAPLGSDRVTVHECGLSDARAVVKFSAGHGSSSRVSDEGETSIRVARLDDIDLPAVTMLKMDIEGAEIPALAGSLETIRKFRPRLAISVYHKAQDFWRIPEVIDSAGVDYELRLRHYTEGIDETVMFFLPVGRDS